MTTTKLEEAVHNLAHAATLSSALWSALLCTLPIELQDTILRAAEEFLRRASTHYNMDVAIELSELANIRQSIDQARRSGGGGGGGGCGPVDPRTHS